MRYIGSPLNCLLRVYSDIRPYPHVNIDRAYDWHIIPGSLISPRSLTLQIHFLLPGFGDATLL